MAQAYVNQKKLDYEVKTLQIQAAQFAKQTGQWITMVENFNQALKVSGILKGRLGGWGERHICHRVTSRLALTDMIGLWEGTTECR